MAALQAKVVTGTKRLAEGDISTQSLEDSKVYIRVPVSKKLLAEKSPVFQRQFCGPMSKTTAAPRGWEYLDIGEFSAEACTEFLSYVLDKTHSYSGHDIELILELCLLADKYQMKELTADLEKIVDKLAIDEKNVFKYLSVVLQKKDLSPLEKVCNMILRNCAEVVHLKQINLLQLWTQYGQENGKLLSVLNTEVQKLEGARSKASITLKINNISENLPYCISPSYVIRNMDWSMVVRQEEDYLAFYLNCGCGYDTDIKWSVNAKVKIYTVDQVRGTRIAGPEMNLKYSPTARFSGMKTCLAKEEVMDPEKGFIKDDAIIFEADVEVGVPQGISWGREKLTKNKLCQNCLYNPCRNGEAVNDAWEGLQVTRTRKSKVAVRRISKDEDSNTSFLHYKYCGDVVHLGLQEISALCPQSDTLRYRCKEEHDDEHES